MQQNFPPLLPGVNTAWPAPKKFHSKHSEALIDKLYIARLHIRWDPVPPSGSCSVEASKAQAELSSAHTPCSRGQNPRSSAQPGSGEASHLSPNHEAGFCRSSSHPFQFPHQLSSNSPTDLGKTFSYIISSRLEPQTEAELELKHQRWCWLPVHSVWHKLQTINFFNFLKKKMTHLKWIILNLYFKNLILGCL